MNGSRILAQGALFILFIAASAGLHARDFYVSTTGNDANNGTSSATPLKTIAKAASLAQAGDSVRIKAGRYNEGIVAVRSGAAGRPIVFRSDGSSPAILTHGTIRGLDNAIKVSGFSHIVIDGIHVDGVRQGPNATVNHFALIQNATHVIVRKGNFRYANGWAGFSVTGTTSYVTIEDNTIDFVGVYDTGTGANSDVGDAIEVRHGAVHHVLIQRNRLKHSAHDLIRLDARNCVVQDNHFDNSYRDVLGGDRGGRDGTIQGVDNLIQRNYLTGSGESSDAARNGLLKIEGVGNIARHNVFADGQNQGIITAAGTWSLNSTDARIYQNTFYKLGSSAWVVRFYVGGTSVGNGIFVNNLVVDSRMNPEDANGDTDIMVAVADAAIGATANNRVLGNVFAPMGNKVPRVVLLGFDGFLEMPAAETRHPTLFSGNRQARAQFVSASPSELKDFDLVSGSAGVNQGVYPTTTRVAGTSTRVPVNDRRFFSDGFGLVQGDLIQLAGSSVRARIVDVDEARGELVLNKSLTFTQGQGVALAYEGSGPDTGAREFGTKRLAPPSNVQAR